MSMPLSKRSDTLRKLGELSTTGAPIMLWPIIGRPIIGAK